MDYGQVLDMCWFGQVPSMYSTGYETIIRVRNQLSPSYPYGFTAPTYPYPMYNNCDFWARGINASTVSVMGAPQCGNGSAFGIVPGCPAMRGGYQNRVLREKIPMSDSGSTTTVPGVLALPTRGWLPNLWQPWHYGAGGTANLDTFTDTVYNPAASFTVLTNSSVTAAVILETTDTWSMPT